MKIRGLHRTEGVVEASFSLSKDWKLGERKYGIRASKTSFDTSINNNKREALEKRG